MLLMAILFVVFSGVRKRRDLGMFFASFMSYLAMTSLAAS